LLADLARSGSGDPGDFAVVRVPVDQRAFASTLLSGSERSAVEVITRRSRKKNRLLLVANMTGFLFLSNAYSQDRHPQLLTELEIFLSSSVGSH
jgi:hypothetical protein